MLGFLVGAEQWAVLSDVIYTTQCAQYASTCQMGADWMWGWSLGLSLFFLVFFFFLSLFVHWLVECVSQAPICRLVYFSLL